MPWILSFAIANGRQKRDREPLPYYEEMKPKRQMPDAKLFLSVELQSRLDQNQILSLPNQNVAFHDICHWNAGEEQCQLLWIPPVVPAYQVKDSLFTRQKYASKLLVFDEHRFLQRGGAALLSQYANARNRAVRGDWETDLADSHYAERLMTFCFPFEDPKTDIERLANLRIPENGVLDKILARWEEGEEALSPVEALAALADPAVCVMRLWQDEKAARTIGAAFKRYLQKEHSRLALAAWMTKHPEKCLDGAGQEDIQLAVLRYCAEGNLFAVLREWLSVGEFSNTDAHIKTIQEVLTRSLSDVRVYVQTQETYQAQGISKMDVCCPCGFAERLTHDHHDVGTATGDAAEEAHKGIREAFNAPFWPMVLFVGRGAQEGFDFHKYCLRIMHLTLPKGAVSFDQRQGRIDRFRSLLVRRRACELLKLESVAGLDLDTAMFGSLEAFKQQDDCPELWKKDQLFPNWQIKEEKNCYQSRHHFERMIPVLRDTDEMLEYRRLTKQLRSYRSTIGSSDIPLPNEDRDLQIDLTAEKHGMT